MSVASPSIRQYFHCVFFLCPCLMAPRIVKDSGLIRHALFSARVPVAAVFPVKPTYRPGMGWTAPTSGSATSLFCSDSCSYFSSRKFWCVELSVDFHLPCSDHCPFSQSLEFFPVSVNLAVPGRRLLDGFSNTTKTSLSRSSQKKTTTQRKGTSFFANARRRGRERSAPNR